MLHYDLKIDVDWALATYSSVELGVPKSSMPPSPSDSEGLGMRDARGPFQSVGADHGKLS